MPPGRPLLPTPARPWSPWLAFGLVIGSLAPLAPPLALARCGLTASPLRLAWLLGLPLALVALASCRRLPSAARWLAFGAAALAGGAWTAARAPQIPAPDRLAVVRGEVRAELWQGFGQGFAIATSDGRLVVRAPATPAALAGDRVIARGATIADARGPALAATAIEVLPREEGPRAWAWRALERVRAHRELAATLLLGCGRPPERSDFRAAGLAHVLAVSGMHLVIAAALSEWLLRALRVPWAARLAASAALVVGYLWLTGGGAATARAAGMALAARAAGGAGREPHALATIGVAAALLVLLEPGVAGDAGFQLSLAAVLGIATVGRELTALRRRRLPLAPWPLDRPAWRALLGTTRAAVDGLAVGLAAVAATAPLVAWHFQVVNAWSPLTSLAAAPPATVALWLGLPLLVVAGLSPGGPWEGWYRALEVDLGALAAVAGAGAALPGAAVPVSAPSPWLLLAWPLPFAAPALVRAWRASRRARASA